MHTHLYASAITKRTPGPMCECGQAACGKALGY
jgi:hypothetical protein